MNIAIIVAVSDYQNINSLPGCKLDAQLMKKLLETTGKYNEIILIDKDNDSIHVKEILSNFITNNQVNKIEELFFYYTGHGDFRYNEFHYLLSDFTDHQYRQTSLSNTELDNFLRQLNPNLTVKIIDACHSGVTYIKDNDIFHKHLDDSKKQFNNCYFMFSSMNDQSSYQSKIISYFTKSFIDSVLNYGSTDVRYKHIIDYISDEFDKNSFQKPFFVIQAGFTEIFCSINQKLKTLLSEQIDNSLQTKFEADSTKLLSLSDLVRKDAERYCSKSEVLEVINEMKTFVENYNYSPEFLDLYTIKPEFEVDYNSIDRYIGSIGRWLEENNNNYFSKVTYQRELVTKSTSPSDLIVASFSAIYGNGNYKTVLSGFELTVDVPFKVIKINAHPKYPNIDWCNFKIAFVFSQVSIRFFYFYSNFKLNNWDNYSHDFSSELQTVEVEIKNIDKLKETMSNILNKFDDFVIEPLKAKYVLTVDKRTD